LGASSGHWRSTAERKPPSLADAHQGTCVAVAREVPADKGLSDESYAAAEKTIGLESLLVLVATVGSFSMTCLAAATFQIDPHGRDISIAPERSRSRSNL
jgi:hypothetical protein